MIRVGVEERARSMEDELLLRSGERGAEEERAEEDEETDASDGCAEAATVLLEAFFDTGGLIIVLGACL